MKRAAIAVRSSPCLFILTLLLGFFLGSLLTSISYSSLSSFSAPHGGAHIGVLRADSTMSTTPPPSTPGFLPQTSQEAAEKIAKFMNIQPRRIRKHAVANDDSAAATASNGGQSDTSTVVADGSNQGSSHLLRCLARGPPESVMVPSSTSPPFAVTLLDPELNHPTSRSVLEYGLTEVHLLQVVTSILYKHCQPEGGGEGGAGSEASKSGLLKLKTMLYGEKKLRADPSTDPGHSHAHKRLRGLFVDVGAGVGFFSLVAASMGCDVRTFEPNPIYRQALNASICANHGFKHRFLNVSESTLGPVPPLKAGTDSHPLQRTVQMPVTVEKYNPIETELLWTPKQDCSPSTAVAVREKNGCTIVPAFPLATLLRNKEEVLLLKLKGDLPSIDALLTKSGQASLQTHRIEHILLTFHPRLYGLTKSQELLRTLDSVGYEISEIHFLENAEGFSFFQQFKSYLASASSRLSLPTSSSSNVSPIKYDALDKYASDVFACQDAQRHCYTHIIASLADMTPTVASIGGSKDSSLSNTLNGGIVDTPSIFVSDTL